MPSPLVECIPNFSEARRPDVVDAISAAIAAVAGIAVLDRHSDSDHNRTVITFVGPPAAVEEAAFRAIAKAAQLIDLEQHSGEHPRIGATDVVPFVPITDVSMAECVEMARRLGRRVGAELGIPVYLYEEAAARPDRQNLENIRRGQYETLKKEIGSVPERAPDFGPARLTGAGATVIGARQPLIAFNVFLSTPDVTIAQKVAKAVRHSSGGLRFVKAMGVLVEGRAQVSMNLTNFRQTPVARVVEVVRREAERYGVSIHHSELVGLIPQEALVDAAQWYLQMDAFQPGQILETRLYQASGPGAAQTAAKEEPNFIDQLAAGTPTPGGGSAAAHTGAAAAALVAMVARLTMGKAKYAAVLEQMKILLDKAENLRRGLAQAVDQDAAAFQAYMEAARLPRSTPQEQEARIAALERTSLAAAQVPLKVGAQAEAVMELAVQAASLGNVNAISDAATGLALARAALTGAGFNVRINALNLADKAAAQKLIDEMMGLEAAAKRLEPQLKQILLERAHISI